MRFNQEWTHFKVQITPTLQVWGMWDQSTMTLFQQFPKFGLWKPTENSVKRQRNQVARDSKQRRAENNSTLKYLKLLILTHWWWWAIFTNIISDGRKNSLVSVTALCSRSSIWCRTCEATLETHLVASTKFGTWDD